jgi:hypothetical protein
MKILDGLQSSHAQAHFHAHQENGASEKYLSSFYLL